MDMESYWAGRVAFGAQVPFLAVRGITDGVEDTVPDPEWFMNGAGRVSPGTFVSWAARYPQDLPMLLRTGLAARRASRALASFAAAFAAKLDSEKGPVS